MPMLSAFVGRAVARLRDDQEGQGLAEYALILALIAIVSIAGLLYFGGQISDKLTVIGNAV